jgi:hypothetical protein
MKIKLHNSNPFDNMCYFEMIEKVFAKEVTTRRNACAQISFHWQPQLNGPVCGHLLWHRINVTDQGWGI